MSYVTGDTGFFDSFITLLETGVAQAAHAGAAAHRADAQAAMLGVKSGRRYGGHTAAAPGEPAGIVTTHLFESVQVDQDGNDAIVYSDDPVAVFQEFGTVRMPAHPFFFQGIVAGQAAAEAALAAWIGG